MKSWANKNESRTIKHSITTTVSFPVVPIKMQIPRNDAWSSTFCRYSMMIMRMIKVQMMHDGTFYRYSIISMMIHGQNLNFKIGGRHQTMQFCSFCFQFCFLWSVLMNLMIVQKTYQAWSNPCKSQLLATFQRISCK